MHRGEQQLGFLDKLKKNNDDGDLPPPPPAAHGEKKTVKTQDPTLPPLPDNLPDMPDEQPAAMPAAPKDKPTPQPSPQQAPPQPPAPQPAPKTHPPQPAPQQAPPTPQQAPPQPAKEPPKPPQNNARQQIRSAFNDLPPIKIDADDSGVITKDQVSELDVDDLVLPGQESPQPAPASQPAPQPQQTPAPRPQPQPQQEPTFTGPLYVDVQTYEDVQKAIHELKKQLKDITADVDDVRSLTEKEDKQFSVVVKKLERIQEDILRVDQDLFEER